MPAHTPECAEEAARMAATGPPLSSDDRTTLVTFVSDLRHLASEVYDLKKDIHEIKSAVASILIKMAETPAYYASQAALGEATRRINSLEATRDADSPRVHDWVAKVTTLEQQLEGLQRQRTSLQAGYRWLIAAGALIYMLLTLAINSKGKLW